MSDVPELLRVVDSLGPMALLATLIALWIWLWRGKIVIQRMPEDDDE